ncbi:MAG: hypothetical protein M0Q46_02715 [Endomicrobiales bacterium]|nr:hypothetical protein [Endomicrobiales bacterium]
MQLSTTKTSTILFIVLISLFAGAIIYFQTLPFTQKTMQSALEQRINAIAKISTPEIQQALNAKDDIALLIALEKLSKQESIESIFVLDKESLVIAHTNTQEWGKKYPIVTSDIFEKLKAQAYVKTKIAQNPYYAFSLSNEHLLFLRASTKEQAAALDTFLRTTLLLCVILIIVLSFVFYYISKLSVTNARNKLLKALTNSSQQLPKDLSRMLGEIKLRLNPIAQDTKAKTNQSKFFASCMEHICNKANGLIIFDIDNTLIFANQNAMKTFGIKEQCSIHLLDAIKNTQTLSQIESAIKTKKPISLFDAQNNLNIKTTAFFDEHTFIGLAIETQTPCK